MLTHFRVVDYSGVLVCDFTMSPKPSTARKTSIGVANTTVFDWSDERFTDDELLNKVKIHGVFKGTEYGDDCQVDITGEFEND